MARQSLGKLTAKHALRTQLQRTISDKVGNGFLGAILKTVASQAIKHGEKKLQNRS